MNRPFARIASAVVALLAAALVWTSHPDGVAAADDGLRIANESLWYVDPASGVVHVNNAVTVTNTLKNSSRGRPYFSAISVVAPLEHYGAHATSDGKELLLTRVDHTSSDVFTVYKLDLPRKLFPNTSVRIDFGFDLLGGAPRSKTPIRINPAFVGFDAFTFGDPFETTLRVVIPQEFRVDGINSNVQLDPSRSNAFGANVYTVERIEHPDEFNLYVSAFNDDKLVRTYITAGKATFEILCWPSDMAWSSSISEQLQAGIPALEEVVGTPWPKRPGTTVIQSQTPIFYGYEGWFNDADNRLEIAETLDPTLTLHELSHAWFNQNLINERWVTEGFAQAVTRRALAKMLRSTTRAEAPLPNDVSAFPLSRWSELSSNIDVPSADRERYGYATADYVIDALYQELGDDVMRTVVAWVAARNDAYRPAEDGQATKRSIDWKYFLDVLEEVGHSKDAEGLFRSYVAAEADLPDLDARRAARQALAELRAETGKPHAVGWIPHHLSSWSFDGVAEEVSLIKSGLSKLATLSAAFASLGIRLPAIVDTWARNSGSTLNDNATALLDAANAVLDLQRRARAAGVDLDSVIRPLLHDLAAGHGISVSVAVRKLLPTIPPPNTPTTRPSTSTTRPPMSSSTTTVRSAGGTTA